MKSLFVKNLAWPSAAITAINIFNYVYLVPVWAQLIVSAVTLVYIGSVCSASLQKASYSQVKACQINANNRIEQIPFLKKCWQIIKFPLMAVLLLFSMYYAIIVMEEAILKWIMNTIFVISTTIYGSKRINSILQQNLAEITNLCHLSDQIQTFLKNFGEPLISILLLSLSILDVVSKYWLLDNFYAILLTICAIKEANMKSFKIILPILWLLFIYDVYSVFHSDVMVTVARNIDLPLKLKFPKGYDPITSEMQFGMLGLGDIVWPGVLISLCIKYDIDTCIFNGKRKLRIEQFKYPFFYSTLLSYGLSLVVTYLIMVLWNHPQPALFYIVPFCTTSILVMAFYSQNKISIWRYNTSLLARRKAQASAVV